jgi:hypothetical protein
MYRAMGNSRVPMPSARLAVCNGVVVELSEVVLGADGTVMRFVGLEPLYAMCDGTSTGIRLPALRLIRPDGPTHARYRTGTRVGDADWETVRHESGRYHPTE